MLTVDEALVIVKHYTLKVHGTADEWRVLDIARKCIRNEAERIMKRELETLNDDSSSHRP